MIGFQLLWTMNTSICVGTAVSPFMLEHDRETRDIGSRALDTKDLAMGSTKTTWVEVLKQRLEKPDSLRRRLLREKKRRVARGVAAEGGKKAVPQLQAGSYV